MGWAYPGQAQIFKFPSPDTLSGNYFGSSVAIEGGLAVVGSSGFNSCGTNSGAAFVYERRTDATWALSAVLQPSDCQEDRFFGKTVSVSGGRIVVTSFRSSFNLRESNGVYIFERDPLEGGKEHGGEGHLSEENSSEENSGTKAASGSAKLELPTDSLKSNLIDSTNVHKNNDLSDLIGRGWSQKARISDPDRGEYGTFASAVSLDKDRIVITAAGSANGSASRGAGYIFDRQEKGNWTLTNRLTAESHRFNGVFGTSCDLDGNRLAISSSAYASGKPGRVTIYDLDPNSNQWRVTDTIEGILAFFMPLDLSGDRLLIGESKAGKSQSGRARLFNFDGAKWKVSNTFNPTLPYNEGGFGTTVSLSGDYALIVGFDEQLELSFNVDRVVYVFHLTNGSWRQRSILDVGNPFFGSDLSFSGNTALIGQSSGGTPGQVYAIQFNRP